MSARKRKHGVNQQPPAAPSPSSPAPTPPAPPIEGTAQPAFEAGEDGKERRFSAQRKADAVLRLLRGESLDVLARELAVTAATIAEWRDRFLAAAQAGLKGREGSASPQDEEVKDLKAMIGELTMRNELLLRERAKFLELGAGKSPFPWRRSTP